MKILVSFCNVRYPVEPVLGILDASTLDCRAVMFPKQLPRELGLGITGLAISPRFLYVAFQRNPSTPSELLIFERTDFTLVNHYMFKYVFDVHSLCLHKDLLYAVSTGTDEVVEMCLQGSTVVAETVYWCLDPQESRADNHHLNALHEWRGELLVSGFGKKKGSRWSSATDGFIMNISRGEKLVSGLYQPHSLATVGQCLAYCQSPKMTACILGEETVQVLPGYTRGLCVIGDNIFVATSVGRQVSKSTGLINNPADTGIPAGRCTISRLSRSTLAVEASADLSAIGREIYDLLPVHPSPRWPIDLAGEFRVFDLARDISACVPAGQVFIFVDQDQFATAETISGRRRIPFLEQGGCYWGLPDGDVTAIREFERLRQSGASFIIFAWPAFWWLDYYTGFHHYLRSNYRCVSQNDRLVVFDLRT